MQTDGEEPDIAFEGLRIWVFGRSYPESKHSWDRNMLTMRLRMKTPGASVDVTEKAVHQSFVSQFVEDLANLNNKLCGTARLKPLEHSFQIEFVGDGKGHLNVTIDLTPNQMTERHKFMVAIDQTYLRSILSGFRGVLEKFPLQS